MRATGDLAGRGRTGRTTALPARKAAYRQGIRLSALPRPAAPAWHRIAPRIARRGQGSREHLGRWRWGVERTFAWLHRYRRLRIRYERRAELHQAFLSLACSLICWKFIDRFY